MFDNKEEVKAWLYANKEYIRYNDPTPGVEDEVIDDLEEFATSKEMAVVIMQKYLLPF